MAPHSPEPHSLPPAVGWCPLELDCWVPFPGVAHRPPPARVRLGARLPSSPLAPAGGSDSVLGGLPDSEPWPPSPQCQNLHDSEHLTWLVVNHVQDLVSLSHEPPVQDFISAVHRNSAASGLFVQAVRSRCENLCAVSLRLWGQQLAVPVPGPTRRASRPTR